MKRINKLVLIILITIILLPNNVFAKEEKPELKWKQKDFRSDTNYRGLEILCDANDGYITINNLGEIAKYDYDGKKVKTIVSECYAIYAIIDDGDLLIYDYQNTLYKYSQSGELIFEKKVDVATDAELIGISKSSSNYYLGYSYYDSNWEAHNFIIKTDKNGNYINRYDFNDININSFIYDNDRIVILANSGKYLIIMDQDFNIINKKELTNLDAIASKIISIEDGYLLMANQVLWDAFAKLDKNGNLIWQNAEIGTITDAVETSDGYIVVGYTGTLSGAYPLLIKFDKEGNVIYKEDFETFENYNYYVLNKIILLNNGDYIVKGSIAPNGYTIIYGSIILKYGYKDYNITTNIKGEGTIEINEIAKEGDKVTFKVNSSNNYELKSIKVVTVSGKVIEVTDNSFIMPDEDIIIEGEFVKTLTTNPKTGNIIMLITGIIVILILGTIITIYYKKKKAKE